MSVIIAIFEVATSDFDFFALLSFVSERVDVLVFVLYLFCEWHLLGVGKGVEFLLLLLPLPSL